jgi:hypothetical protein
MHPRIAELFTYLDQQHAALRATVDAIPPERLAESPEESQWSVIQVLQHLVMLEGQLTRLFAKLVRDGLAQGLRADPDTASVLATFDTARFLDRRRRITAPENLRPATADGGAAPEIAEVMRALDEARARLKAAILEGDGLALGELSYAHPSLGTLDMYQWIAFVGAHMARHTAQIREIGAALGDPARAR